MNKLVVRDLGLLDYALSLEFQLQVVAEVKAGGSDTVLLTEHPPVLTLGAGFHPENLLLSREEYADRDIDISPSGRGGDVTFHGPGQLVIYPIFNVERYGRDLHKWLRALEETMMVTVAEFGVEGRRFKPHTGVWVGDLEGSPKKLAAIGIRMSSWVSYHGIALNCDLDLGPFETIVSCGIKDFGVTSLSQELGRNVTTQDVKPAVIRSFETVFSVCQQ